MCLYVPNEALRPVHPIPTMLISNDELFLGHSEQRVVAGDAVLSQGRGWSPEAGAGSPVTCGGQSGSMSS
jgi:hypothetical protein